MDILKQWIKKECQKKKNNAVWKEQEKEADHRKNGLMRLKRI
jgi:hypothetical protein